MTRSMHLGQMQAATQEWGPPVTAARLEPFAQRGLSLPHLAAARTAA